MELDDSAFGRAILNSAVATRLSQELQLLAASPVPCVKSAKVVVFSGGVVCLGEDVSTVDVVRDMRR